MTDNKRVRLVTHGLLDTNSHAKLHLQYDDVTMENPLMGPDHNYIPLQLLLYKPQHLPPRTQAH